MKTKIARLGNGLLAMLFAAALIVSVGVRYQKVYADGAPPDTTILTHPGNVDSDTTPTFSFSVTSDDISVVTTCQIDSGSFVPCSSPYTAPTLSSGSHTFTVQATDSSEQTDPTPASYTWTVGTPSAITGGSDVSGVIDQNTAINDIHIDGEGNMQVHLEVTDGTLSMATTTGLTFTGASTGSALSFSGDVSDVNTALATLSYVSSTAGEDTLDISLRSDNQIMYGNHAYEVISGTCEEGDTSGCISWDDAKTAAEARTYLGVPGYLASITSDEENTYLASHLAGGASWIGASDTAVEGTWKWVGGPDDGLHFWTGEGETGATEPGQYSNWNPGEPNNSAPAENCGEMYAGDSTGQWNDLPCDQAILGSYMVEYGDDAHPITIPSHSLTITTTPVIADDMTINDCEQLQSIDALDNTYGATYTLAHDIDCSMTNPDSANFDPDGTWSDGLGFVPIGSSNADFAGELDGAGHKITGLFINRDSDDSVGLFSTTTSDSYIHDLELTDALIYGDSDTGTLAGNSYGDVTNVSVTTDLTGNGSYVGGLVGYAGSGDFTDVHVSGHVFADGEEGGGIIGEYDGGVISNCSFSGDIQSYYESGGIIGENEGSVVIHRCYSEGSITADDTDTGGIVGEVEDDITISESFSTMDVIGDDVGGLIGTVYGNTEVTDSYFNGSVGGYGDAGSVIGFGGYYDVAVTNTFGTGSVAGTGDVAGFSGTASEAGVYYGSFWDKQTTGQEDGCVPNDVCDGVLGKATAQMKTKATFTSELGEGTWDFTNVWGMTTDGNDGYPCLLWTAHSCHSADLDQDGTPNSSEDAGPNGGDANGDGVKDSLQSNVSSLMNSVSGKYAVLETSCETNSGVSIVPESATDKDAGYDYSVGLINFTASGCGSLATITQYFYGDYDASKLTARKYNPTTHAYTTISGASLTNTEIGGQKVLKVVYAIADNGPLDLNVASGIITDPSGPATQSVGAPNTGLHR